MTVHILKRYCYRFMCRRKMLERAIWRDKTWGQIR
jgi:hypothetical protein